MDCDRHQCNFAHAAGILRVHRELSDMLTSCGDYFVHYLRIDPSRLGTKVKRDRVYILMILKGFMKLNPSKVRHRPIANATATCAV